MAKGFAVSLALAVLLAGCVGGEAAEKPAPEPTATASDSTGGIEGHIITDEIQPIAGAQVKLHNQNTTLTTKEGGAFAFSELEPGTYTILAAALGYFSNQVKVQVVAGEITDKVLIILDRIPVAAPSFDEIIKFEDTLIVSDTCPGAPDGTEGAQGIVWQDYKLPINASKEDGTPLAAVRTFIELKSQPDAATVDIDLYLLDPKGTQLQSSTSAGPDENITVKKILEPGEYTVRVCLWLGANAHYSLTMTITYEQGEAALYAREKGK
jgi:hypothetical protein